jgi:hypothetical protein
MLPGASDGIVVQGSSTGCSPMSINIPMGNTAKITLRYNASEMFLMTSPELNLNLMSAPGSSASQIIKTSTMGTFNFECGVHGGTMHTGHISITM